MYYKSADNQYDNTTLSTRSVSNLALLITRYQETSISFLNLITISKYTPGLLGW